MLIRSCDSVSLYSFLYLITLDLAASLSFLFQRHYPKRLQRLFLIDAPIILQVAFLFAPLFVDTGIFQFVTKHEHYAVISGVPYSSIGDDDDSSFGSWSTPIKSPATSSLRQRNSRADPSADALQLYSPWHSLVIIFIHSIIHSFIQSRSKQVTVGTKNSKIQTTRKLSPGNKGESDDLKRGAKWQWAGRNACCSFF